jgi:hypothetical protein
MLRTYPGLQFLFFAFILAFFHRTLAHESEPEDPALVTRDSVPLNSAISAAVVSAPDSRWFWTGRKGACASEADGAKNLAMSLASSYGGSTLEQRLQNKKVDMPQLDHPLPPKLLGDSPLGRTQRKQVDRPL